MSEQRDLERRVVITGAGVVSPIGVGLEEFWNSLATGRSGIGRVELLPASPMPGRIAGEVRGFEASKFTRTKEQKKSLKVMCRDIQLGVVSAWLALEDLGLKEGLVDPERLGVEFGANLMFSPPVELSRPCFASIDPTAGKFDFHRWGTHGMGDLEPLWLLKYLPNMPACHIGIFADARGPNNSLTHDDAAGGLVIGEAARVVARGHADVMITGSTGTRLHPVKSIHAVQWDQLAHDAADPATVCRPFDRERSGQVVSEAACTIILEEEQHAAARGAKVYGRILGSGGSCVIDRDGKPDLRRALALAMKRALDDARLQPGDVGHINAHATGEVDGDRLEAEAIHDVFGPIASRVPVTALKSFFGNSGSGNGVLELTASLLGLQRGVVPPTLNYTQPDPTCALNVVHGEPLPVSNRVVLKTSVTRQGQASAVVACGV